MANNEDGVTELTLDIGDTALQAKEAAKAFEGVAAGMKQVTGVVAKFNTEGEQVGYVLSGIDEAGRKVSATFAQFKIDGEIAGFAQLAVSVARAKTEVVNFGKIQEEFYRANLKRQRNTLTTRYVDPDDRRRLRSPDDEERPGVLKRQSFVADRAPIVAPEDRLAQRQSRDTYAQQQAAAAALRSQVSNLSAASAAELRALDAAINKVVSNIGRAGVDLNGLQNLFARMTQGATQFTEAEGKIIAQFKQIEQAAAAVGTASNRAFTQNFDKANASLEKLVQSGQQYTQKLQESAAAEEQAQKAASDNLKIKLAQVRAEAQIKDLHAQQADVKATAESQAQEQNAKGQLIAKLELLRIETEIADRTSRTHAAQQQVLNDLKQQAAQFEIIRKLINDSAALRDKQRHVDNNESFASSAGRELQGQFANRLAFANPAQILAFNQAVAETNKLFLSGKVTASEYAAAIQAFGRGQKITTELNPALVELQAKLQAVRNSFNATGNDGAKAGSSIFLSWQNVVRIFEAQVLYSVFGQLQSGFSGATQAAADYSKQIALIQTISQDAGLSTNQWASGVRKLSDELGTPIAETAAAAYETLSNQVAKGADAFGFLTTAGNFARTTGSKVEDSVDLLSSALNSFELDATQAERVAKSFFTTIDLGRVKTPELANSFGRSGVLAHQLGISLEELNAAISTLTRQGIKPNEAYTLLNNVFQKLIKPTEALQGFFKEIGVSSGEAAIQTFKLTGVLEKLDAKFRGSASEAAKYFDEIRGGRGIRNLTGSGLDQFKGDLAQNLNSSENYANAKDIVKNSFGQRFEDQANKIKNFFVQDVGGTFLRNIVQLTDKVGGLANAFIKVTQTVVKLAIIAGSLYAAFKLTTLAVGISKVAGELLFFASNFTRVQIATEASRIAMKLFGVESGIALGIATAGISILVTGLIYAGTSLIDFTDSTSKSIGELTESFREGAQERISTALEESGKLAQAYDEALANVKTSFLEFSVDVRLGLEKIVEAFREQAGEIADAVKAQFDVVGGIIRSQLQEQEAGLKKAASDVDKLKKSIADDPQKFQGDLYRRNVARNEENVRRGGPDKSFELAKKRIDELKEGAKIKLFNEKDIEGGIKLLDEAEDVAKDLASKTRQHAIYQDTTKQVPDADPLHKGKQPGTHTTRKRIGTEKVQPFELQGEQLLRDIYAEQLKLKQDALKVRQQDVKLLEDQGTKQRALFEQFQEAQKDNLKFSIFDKKGDLKKEYEGPGGAEKAQADLKKTQDRSLGLLGALGAGFDTKIHSVDQFNKQQEELKKLFGRQSDNTKGSLGAANALREHEEETSSLEQNLGEAQSKRGELNNQDAQNKATQEQTKADLQGQLAILKKSLEETSLNPFNRSPATVVESSNKLQETVKSIAELEALLGQSSLDKADADKVKKLFIVVAEGFDQLNRRAGTPFGQSFLDRETGEKGANGERNQTYGDAVARAGRAVVTLQGTASAADDIKKGLEESDLALKSLEATASRIDPKFKSLVKTAQGAGIGIANGLSPAALATRQLQESITLIEASLARLAQIKNDLKLPSVTTTTPGGQIVPGKPQSRGGPVGYYAKGGFLDDFLSGKYARGTDVIPTMLSKGEYVMDARNTQRFLPLLRSMSAGKLRTQSASTGSVTHVGDISITVQGGNTSAQTVKQIGTGLRRALRQGTVSFDTK